MALLHLLASLRAWELSTSLGRQGSESVSAPQPGYPGPTD